MKKTIAAILVAILASAGYIVLDRSTVEKIDRMDAQVAMHQRIIDDLNLTEKPTDITRTTERFTQPSDVLEMWTGCTLRSYPASGSVVQAYVIDYSRITTTTTSTTTTTTTTTRPWVPSTTAAPATTTTTKPETCTTAPAETTVPSTTHAVRAQGEEEAFEEPTPTYSYTNPTVTGPTFTYPEEPTTRYYSADYWWNANRNYYYPLRADVHITSFRCEMCGRSMTNVPEFYIRLTGSVDPSYAGRYITACFDDAEVNFGKASGMIRSDGSFILSTTSVELANAAVAPLNYIRID